MFDRLRNGTLAGGVALALALVFSGAVLGASLPADTGPTTEDTPFVDVDGDGVADHCDDEVIEDAEAAQAAFDAADLDGDGEISVSEAAQTGWTGGLNCNHGGYVSEVANGNGCTVDEPEAGQDEGVEQGGDEAEEQPEADEEADEDAAETEDCAADDEEETEQAETADAETCEVVEAPEIDPETDTSLWNHGDWVTWVAKSDAVGGKNCNHGGAVSEASKAANEAAKAERDLKKAEREAARAAKKAERDLKKAEREAARAAKGHGKP